MRSSYFIRLVAISRILVPKGKYNWWMVKNKNKKVGLMPRRGPLQKKFFTTVFFKWIEWTTGFYSGKPIRISVMSLGAIVNVPQRGRWPWSRLFSQWGIDHSAESPYRTHIVKLNVATQLSLPVAGLFGEQR